MEALQERYRERSKAAAKETWVAASLGWDARHVEEGFAVRFALSHEATLVIMDGPPDAGLKEAGRKLAEKGYHTAENGYTAANGYSSESCTPSPNQLTACSRSPSKMSRPWSTR